MSKKNKVSDTDMPDLPKATRSPATRIEAASYAGETRLAQVRLLDCIRLIEEGKTGEAVLLATRKPELVPLCHSLAKQDFEEWVQICETEQWPEPVFIDPAQVARVDLFLKQNLLDEAALTKALRQAIRAKDNASAIQVLRQLRVLQPGKQELRQDLSEFERTRLDVLKTEIPRVMAVGDESAVLQLAAELEDEWVVSIPTDLKEPLLAKAEEIRIAKRVAEVSGLIDKISMAYAAGDWKKAAPLVGQVEGLIRAQSLELPMELKQEWDDDLEWFHKEKAKADKQRHFDGVVRQLEDAVKEGDVEAMDRALREARVIELPFSDELARQAELKIQNAHTVKSRAKKRNTALMLVVLAMLAAGGLYYASTIQKSLRVAAVTKQLKEMSTAEAEDLEGMLSLKQRLETQEPEIFQIPAVQDHLALTNQVAEIRSIRRQELEEILTNVRLQAGKEELLTVSAATFLPLKELVESSLDRAEKELVRNQSEVAALSEVAQHWSEAVSKREQTRQDTWRAWFREALAMFSELESLKAEPLISVEKEKEFKHFLTSLPERPDTVAQSQFEKLSGDFQKWETKGENLNDQLNRIAEAENLSDYLKEIETFVLAYPDQEQVPVMKKILSNRKMYEDFATEPASAGIDNPFWGKISTRMTSRELDQDLWTEVRDEIVSWDVEKALVDVYFGDIYAGGTKRLYFIYGPLPLTVGKGDSEKVEVEAYIPMGGNEKSPVFETKEMTVWYIKSMKRLPICDTISKLFAKLRYTQSHEGYETLLTEIHTLIGDKKLNGIFQLDMGKSLLEQAVKIAPEEEKLGLKSILDRMSSVDNSIHWLCYSHPQYDEAKRAASQMVAGAANLLKSYIPSASQPILDQVVLKRQPVFVGHRDFDTEEFLGSSKLKELWVVRETSDGPRFYIQSVKTLDGIIQNTPLEAGEPVFAPKDGSTTSEVLLKEMRLHKFSLSELRTSPSWPTNIPELPTRE